MCGEVDRGVHGGLCGVSSLEGGVQPIIWQSERMCTERGFWGLQITFRVRFHQYFNFHFNNVAET